MWSVECSNFFFFSKGIFYPRPEAFVSGRLSHFSAQRLSELTEIWERFLMLTRSREAALPTISHCVSGEPRRHVSPTVEPGKLFSLEEQRQGVVEGGVQMRGRKEKHRSNGHREVYHISIQPESEKLSQSQLGVFWRKKLTRGKNRINITALNQYIKTLQCTFERLLEKVRTCSDSDSTWLCLQTAQVRGIQTVGMKGWHWGSCLRNQLGFA